MKKILLLIIVLLSMSSVVKANQTEDMDYLAFCYGVYENVKSEAEIKQMRDLLNTANPEIYTDITQNPAFINAKKNAKNIDLDTQRKCISVVYGFLTTMQVYVGQKAPSTEVDVLYCLAYLEKAKNGQGMISDYCSVDLENKNDVRECQAKLMAKFKQAPSFMQGFEDASLVNPMQFTRCGTYLMKNFNMLEKFFAD